VSEFTFEKDKKIEALEKELQEKKEEVKELRLLLNRQSELFTAIRKPTQEFTALKSSEDEGEFNQAKSKPN
jgi:predicted RNase H-like nuclease (RuvC/YqgF family)